MASTYGSAFKKPLLNDRVDQLLCCTGIHSGLATTQESIFNANGNQTAEVVDIVRTTTTTQRRHFTYDASNRLISVHSDAAKRLG